MQWIALLLTLTSSIGFAQEAAQLLDINPRQEKQGFVTELKFNQVVQADTLNVQFINETVQIDIPGVNFPEGQKSVRVNNPMVKNVYTYQLENNQGIRSRIIYKGIAADTFKDAIQVFADGQTLKVVIGSHPKEEPVPVAAPAKKVEAAAAPAVSKEDAIMAVTPPTLIQEGKSDVTAAATSTAAIESAAKAMTVEEIAGKKESEIPVLAPIAKKGQVTSDSTSKVLASLGILIAVLLVGFVGVRRWVGKAAQPTKHTQIKVLTQHYLGPKKTLAIIRVAGESMLIGITDHNISMIKSLSLLDEEIPEEVPQNFNKIFSKQSNSVSGAGMDEGDEAEDFSFAGIKDVVSNRLKGMRSI